MAEVPTPILVLSARETCAGSAAAVESLLAGAVEALPKPERWDAEAERQVRCRVRLLSRVAVVAHPRGRRRPPAPDPYRAPPVAIAASTGGPAALAEILPCLGGLAVPVLVVQHLHPQLVDGFVGWMQRVSALPVVVAADGDRPQPGVVYIASAGAHLRLAPAPGVPVLPAGPPRTPAVRRPAAGPRPRAGEPAPAVGGRAVRFGRGHGRRAERRRAAHRHGDDGAAGLLAMRRQGAVTIVQDEASSVVFGMPRAAQELGAAAEVLALGQLHGGIRNAVGRLVR
jgi:two-component system, chemotaxis family, protein-glutamate methylesterase/glutaminase